MLFKIKSEGMKKESVRRVVTHCQWLSRMDPGNIYHPDKVEYNLNSNFLFAVKGRYKIYLFSVLIFILPMMDNARGQSDKVFRAGASTSNITPMLGEPIVGNFNEPLAENIHDDLHARALVLDDGDTRIAIVLVDNVGVDQAVLDEAKKLIFAQTGLPKDRVLIASVHDHSAASAGGKGLKRRGWLFGKPLDEYQTFLIRRIADGVQVAVKRLEPARIGWGVGKVPQHLFNRRYFMKEPVRNPFGGWDKVQMNPGIGNPKVVRPAGGTDPEVSFISVQSVLGRPIALLANYSLHYVGGVPANDISGDYFAVFANKIQKLLKAEDQDPPFVGIMSNGTSGDINNIDVLGKPTKKYKPYEKMQVVAEDVANEVFRVYQNIKHQNWVKIQAIQSELLLNVRRATPEMYEHITRILARPDTAKPLYHPLEKIYAQRILQMELEWPNQMYAPLQAFRIGDLGIAAIPFEVFTKTGLDIKAKSPFKPTFTIEIANGYYGYLPTPDQHEWGGYETWLSTNRVEPQASEKIVAELMNLFSKLK